MSKKWNGLAPFKKNHKGEVEMQEWVGYDSDGESRDPDIVWAGPDPWFERLQYLHCWRGRSAARFVFKGMETGRIYSMAQSALGDCLENCSFEKGVVSSTWKFVKGGSNYGIAPVVTR